MTFTPFNLLRVAFRVLPAVGLFAFHRPLPSPRAHDTVRGAAFLETRIA